MALRPFSTSGGTRLWYPNGEPMKYLFALLVLSTVTVVVASIAMWWRLRRHLKSSDEALKKALLEIEPLHEPEPEREPVEK